jgi:hypothetical protein
MKRPLVPTKVPKPEMQPRLDDQDVVFRSNVDVDINGDLLQLRPGETFCLRSTDRDEWEMSLLHPNGSRTVFANGPVPMGACPVLKVTFVARPDTTRVAARPLGLPQKP